MKRPRASPGKRPPRPTPKAQGLHAVSLILSEPLYEGMRLYCFRNRIAFQDLLRRLLGEFLSSKGVTRPKPAEGGETSYELLARPEGPIK